MIDQTHALGRVALWLAICLLSAAASAEDRKTLNTEIEYLLARVADSGYVFIRNGDEHDGVDAAKHMRRKYEHFRDKGKIDSIDDFIELSATKSMITGKLYMIRMGDDPEIPTATWLHDEIDAYRQRTEVREP